MIGPHVRLLANVVSLSTFAIASVYAQPSVSAIQLRDRGPLFYASSPKGAVPADVRTLAVLQEQIATDLDDVSVRDAVRSIARAAHVEILFADSTLPADRRVTLQATKITLAAALTDVLLDAGVDIWVSRHGSMTLVRRQGGEGPVKSSSADSTGVVSGHVVDAVTSTPLDQAVVVIQGLGLRATTGSDGRYRLARVPAGTRVVLVRAVGHVPAQLTVTVVAGQLNEADFSLSKSTVLLDRVVTTATGDRAAVSMGERVETIEAAPIVASGVVSNISDVLNARVAGLQVFQPGGLVGASPQMTLRGLGSLSLSSQPLLYVDGIRVQNSFAAINSDGSPGVSAGGFDDIMPDEIESIEVVKGPSAATLYGTDAATGVILITTKKGMAGRPRWTMYGEKGTLTENKSRFPDAYYAWGHTAGSSPVAEQCLLVSAASGDCSIDSVTHFSPLKVASLTPIGEGSLTDLGVQVQGGGDVRYFFSGAYTGQLGVFKMPQADLPYVQSIRGPGGITPDEAHPNGLTKYSGRENVVAQIGKSGDVSLSSAFLTQTSRIPNPFVLELAEGLGYRDSTDGWSGGRPADLFLQEDQQTTYHFTGSATSNWYPFSWLSARGTAGLDYAEVDGSGLVRLGEGGPFTPSTRTAPRLSNWIESFDANATALFDLGADLNSRTSLGGSVTRNNMHQVSATIQNLAPGCSYLTCGATPFLAESYLRNGIAGIYGEETVGWKQRLFLSGAIRADGASSFGHEVKVVYYPKASASWLIIDDQLGSRIIAKPSVRLRGAYGASGTQPTTFDPAPEERVGPAFVNGASTTGSALGSVGNANLKPERIGEFETGLDLSLFNHRIEISPTYFDKRTTDALVNQTLPTSLGATSQEINVGSVRNWGYELESSIRVLASRAITWDFEANGSINHNTVVKLEPGLSPTYNQFGVPSIAPGYPLYSVFDIPYTYADANGNHLIEPSEITYGNQVRFGGPTYPKTQLSLSSAVSLFHNLLRLSVLVDHRGEFTIPNIDIAFRCYSSDCRGVNDPRASLQSQAAAQAALTQNDFWGYFENGSFTRLREVALTLNIPEAGARFMRLRSASVTLSGRNLAIWTKFTGADPEVVNNVGFTNQGAYNNYAGLPPATYWLLRCNIGL